ncbi:DUF1361 domain-containing protein [Patiriisocius marinus]|uniref:Membrane protein n=1 Tax=Patiriisocius marinus TaxID=1397112 RepID=A0A5J4IQ93_9FLAO|nr:DUF1361 domain-containing protein [Patiriisocius marinus]GER59965.1 membrane protein [Patiriisocius marinus]
MKHIKAYVFQNFETLAILSIATISSIALLGLRLKITQSFFLIFLVWNLFLAAVPYIVSSYLESKNDINTFTLVAGSSMWLLFLPNAPYILTDLIHLTNQSSVSIVIDGIIISAFALSGLLFYLYSVRQMMKIFERKFSKKIVRVIKFMIPFLSGYGIYLGRFERWNSWNIAQNPLGLLNNVLTSFIDESKIGLVITTTVFIGSILLITNYLFIRYISKQTI